MRIILLLHVEKAMSRRVGKSAGTFSTIMTEGIQKEETGLWQIPRNGVGT